jgi:benzoyl-CoA reductase/2-hydroxyglutaryl-CoA dehydratase subunit BcrC/BadD/HgdB
VNEVLACTDALAVIVTTACDQMRRAFDIIDRQTNCTTFLMNIPSTWEGSGALGLYLDELRRLGRFLVRQGGKSPSPDELAGVMLEYDATRRSILKQRPHLTARRFSEAVASFNRNGKSKTANRHTRKESLTGAAPLAILGGPLLQEDFEIFDVIENAGGKTVLDATETGERGICAEFDPQRWRDGPLEELCRAYFGRIVDAFRRPNTALYDWLGRQLNSRQVCGIIFRRYIWCDIWHAELYRLRKWTKLPVLDICEKGDGQALSLQTESRLRSFVETLQ